MEMKETATGVERSEPGDSEQDEEDVYEVERIIDMRTEEGEVLYRVRWKNYTSDEDTWEPEAHLEDCREVLLAYRKKLAESRPTAVEVEVARALGDSAVQERQLAVTPKGIVGTQEEEQQQVKLTASGLQRDLAPKKLQMNSDLFDVDSDSVSDQRNLSSPRKKKNNLVEDLPPETHTKKKKKEKKKLRQEKVLPGPQSDRTETSDEDGVSTHTESIFETKRALESDDDVEAVTSPKKRKKEKSIDRKHWVKDKAKDSRKHKKSREGKNRKEYWNMLDSSEEEDKLATADGELSETSKSQTEKAVKPAEKPHHVQGEELTTSKPKQKQSKSGLKLQGIRDLIHQKNSKKPQAPPILESTHQKLKKLMSIKSQSKAPRSGTEDEPSRPSSDSSDVPAAMSVKRKSKSKVLEAAIQHTASSSPSSSSSSAAIATKEDEAKPEVGSASGPKGKSSAKLEDSVEKDHPASTNLFEKFLLNCEAKDRVPRRQSTQPSENRAEQAKTATPKTTGKAEKKTKTLKESLAQKLEADRTEKAKKDAKIPEAPGQAKNPAILEVEEKSDGQGARHEKGDRRTERREEQKAEEATESRVTGVPWEKPGEVREHKERGEEPRERRDEPRGKGEESRGRAEEPRERREEPRERKERMEDTRGCRSERKLAADVASPEPADEAVVPGRMKERKRRREDSEPRLYIACEDNQDPQDLLGHNDGTKELPADRGQTALNIGVDLKLDWMTLDDFQKHLNGDDEIISAAALSPGELRDAVKSGDYLAVKLALSSKEDYNLDQEDSSGMSLAMLTAAGGQDDILRLLIKKGVKVNGRQKNGTTALMHAAEKKFLSTVAILLEAGAHVNAQTLGGETALMKACKRGNADVVRLLLEHGADCNILSKHQNNALHFAKLSNNVIVYDHVKDHGNMLSSVAEGTVRAYFETRLALLEPVFPLACHRLCEGPDFSLEFNYKPPPHSPVEGSGILLFVFHANFLSEITARLCGPCSVHAVVLNDKFQLPIFLDSHFIYSFSPVQGPNKLFVRLAESPNAKVKLLICAYRVQVQ